MKLGYKALLALTIAASVALAGCAEDEGDDDALNDEEEVMKYEPHGGVGTASGSTPTTPAWAVFGS